MFGCLIVSALLGFEYVKNGDCVAEPQTGCSTAA